MKFVLRNIGKCIKDLKFVNNYVAQNSVCRFAFSITHLKICECVLEVLFQWPRRQAIKPKLTAC